jgi:hypothetical protein
MKNRKCLRRKPERLLRQKKQESLKVLRGNKIVKPRTEVPNDNRCIDCRSLIVDEFPEVPYIGCSGCPRIYARKKGD